MSYIGNPVTTAAFLVDTFSGNSSNTAFTLSVAPATSSSIIVAISGLVQEPSTYGVSGRTLTFTGVPPTGTNNISVRYLGIPATGVTTAAYRSVTEFIAASGQTSFEVPSYTAGYIDVYQNGIQLASDDFTASDGVNIVLTNAATAGDSVRIIAFQLTNIANALPTSGGNISGNLNLASDLNFTGVGNRIRGDFSNLTIVNRAMFQTSTANSVTVVSAIPNGSSTQANFNLHNNSDPTNASDLRLLINSSEARLQSSLTGTGTFLPMTFYTGGSERVRIDTSGNVGIGTQTTVANSAALLQVAGTGTKGSLTLARTDAPTSGSSICGIDAYGFDGTQQTVAGTINFRAAENWTSTNHGSVIQFRTTASGSGGALFEAMRIDAGGNVGINTTSIPLRLNGKTLAINGTVSGQNYQSGIEFQSNTVSGGEIWYNLSQGMVLNSYQNLPVTVRTNNTERFKIDELGRVTKSYQPAFQAQAIEGDTIYGNQVLPYGGEILNVGGHYNKTTSRFTAPVAGVYMFAWDVWHNSSTNTGTGRAFIRKNGQYYKTSTYGGSAGLHTRLGDNAGDDDSSKTVLMYLNVSDYVDIYNGADNVTLFYSSGFCGYLLG